MLDLRQASPDTFDLSGFSLNTTNFPYLKSALNKYKYIDWKLFYESIIAILNEIKESKKEVLESFAKNFIFSTLLNELEGEHHMQYDGLKPNSMYMFFMCKFHFFAVYFDYCFMNWIDK